jgi:ribosomal protein S18 acetylase RimI-like enzyme
LSASFDALDNPFWACLATRHAHVARGGTLARRYPPDISPIAALSGDSPAHVAALETLVEAGDDMGTLGPWIPKLGRNWEIVHEAEVTQMLRAERTPLSEGPAEAAGLGPNDVAEMLSLVELTQPGPFRRRTIELGRFIGIREEGRLVAMAGERSWIGDCREVSGVCTHPDAQGRGHARKLIARVVNRMLRAGETPFLHTESGNARAIALYESLGFVERRRFPLLAAKRVE